MKKAILCSLVISFLFSGVAFAEYSDEEYVPSAHYAGGMQYLQNYQYTSAISEFKAALRENPTDSSAKIGLINSYISRAAYYNNKSSDYQKAANDLRSALFYMKYYDNLAGDYNTTQAMESNQKNLDMILSEIHADRSSKGIYLTAKTLRNQRELAASAYEFFQLINDSNYKKDAYANIGDIMNIFNLHQKAVFYLERAVSLDSKNVNLHLSLARAYDAIGNSEGAIKEYNYALTNSSEKEDILASLEANWLGKVQANPSDAEAHANLGAVYQKEGNYTAALAEYQKAQAINPTNETTRMNMGTLYQIQKNYAAAIPAYDSILALYPNNVQALIYKAQCLKELGQNEEAVKAYKLAISFDPDNSDARTQLFDLLKKTMPVEQVLAYLYQNVQNQPMNASNYYDFAYELHKAGKLDDAIVYYKETLKLDPKNIDSYINLSQVYRQKGDLTQAWQIIQSAKAIFPENVEIKKQYNSIIAEQSSNVYTEATKLFEQSKYQDAIIVYTKIQPPTTESLLGIAASYQALENFKQAAEYYKKALAKDPSNPDIIYYLGAAYVNLDDYVNGKIYLEKAITLDKTNAKAKDLLKFIADQENAKLLDKAVSFYDTKKYAESLKTLNNIIMRDSRNGNAYYYRGMVYDAEGKYNLAVVDYQNALRYNKELTLAYYSLAIDYDSLGKFKEAVANYKKYLATKPDENDYTKYARKRALELKKYDQSP